MPVLLPPGVLTLVPLVPLPGGLWRGSHQEDQGHCPGQGGGMLQVLVPLRQFLAVLKFLLLQKKSHLFRPYSYPVSSSAAPSPCDCPGR